MTDLTDFSIDCRRLERIIKILFRHLKKVRSDEKLVRLSNSIAFITSKKIEVAKIQSNLQERLDKIEEQLGIERKKKKLGKR